MVGNATREPYQVPNDVTVSKGRGIAYLIAAFVLGALIF